MKIQILSYCGMCRNLITCNSFEKDSELGYVPGKDCPLPDVPELERLMESKEQYFKRCAEFVAYLWKEKQ